MRTDWRMLLLSVLMVLLGVFGLAIAVRPQTTWAEALAVAKWVYMISIPVGLMLLGAIGIWLACPSKRPR